MPKQWPVIDPLKHGWDSNLQSSHHWDAHLNHFVVVAWCRDVSWNPMLGVPFEGAILFVNPEPVGYRCHTCTLDRWECYSQTKK